MNQYLAPGGQNQLLAQTEDAADNIFRKTKTYLPHVARLCLISTFLEDGVRMYFQWDEQKQFLEKSWEFGSFFSTVFVFYNMVGQLIPVLMILLRTKVLVAVGILASIVVFQTIAYHVWDLEFLSRNAAVAGALVLLAAETQEEKTSLFAGVPTMGDSNKPKSYLLLVGRFLMVFMFLTLAHYNMEFLRVVEVVVGLVLIVLVAVGYKTKLSALILIMWLTAINFYLNAWWMVPADKYFRDFMKYDFFQTMSVVGGLLLVVIYGAGGISIDDYKKRS